MENKPKSWKRIIIFASPPKVLCLLLPGSYCLSSTFLTCLVLMRVPPGTRVKTCASPGIVTLNSFLTWDPFANLIKTMDSFKKKKIFFSHNFRDFADSLKIIHEHSNPHVIVRVHMLGSWSWHWLIVIGKSFNLSSFDLGTCQMHRDDIFLFNVCGYVIILVSKRLLF